MLKNILFVLVLFALRLSVISSDELKNAKSNTWVKISEEKTGFRYSPAFFYSTKLKRYVETLGGSYTLHPRHYDNEEFDLAELTWKNAYPKNAPISFKPAYGVTDAPNTQKGRHRSFFKDKHGNLRIPYSFGGYGYRSCIYGQYAFKTKTNELFAVASNNLYVYNVDERQWQDLGESEISKSNLGWTYGSLCYDELNDELVTIGGNSDEKGGTPGTWIYQIKNKKWVKASVGSENYKKLLFDVEAFQTTSWRFFNLVKNRYHSTETERESKIRVDDLLKSQKKTIKKLQIFLSSTKWENQIEKNAIRKAKEILAEVLKYVTQIDAMMTSPVDIRLVEALSKQVDLIDTFIRSLDTEPTGRATSQMVYDPVNQVIVLFGGDGLDRQYSDTWVYSCKDRRWEQRYPKVCPSPRAGHAMVWLPKSKQILLVGGFGVGKGSSGGSSGAGLNLYKELPLEMWVYDAKTNFWKIVSHLPMPSYKNENVWRKEWSKYPKSSRPHQYVMAANEDDIVVMLSSKGSLPRFGTGGRILWACKVDPNVISENEFNKYGVSPNTTAFRDGDRSPKSYAYDPLVYDKVEVPNENKMDQFLSKVQPNEWTQYRPLKKLPIAVWGTSAYDAKRDQLLFWGGGHSSWNGMQVNHFSLKTGMWSMSYRPDFPMDFYGSFTWGRHRSFRNHPVIPVHAWSSYTFDEAAGKMLYMDRVYDPSIREWEIKKVTGLKSKGPLFTVTADTPTGAVALTHTGFYQYVDKKKAWRKLPWNGPKVAKPWGDGHGIRYDADEDCLWISTTDILKYDMKTGNIEVIKVKAPVSIFEPKRKRDLWTLWRESRVLPKTDWILLMRLFRDSQGNYRNIMWNKKSYQFYWIDLAYRYNGKPYKNQKGGKVPLWGYGWSSSMHYEKKRNIFWQNHPDQHSSVWALKLDLKTAKIELVK